MRVSLSTVKDVQADVLVRGLFEGASTALADMVGLSGMAERLGKNGAVTLVHAPAGSGATLVCLAGLGKQPGEKPDEELADLFARLGSAMAAAMGKIRELKVGHVVVDVETLLHEGLDPVRLIYEVAYAMHISLYQYLALKKTDEASGSDPEQLTLHCPSASEEHLHALAVAAKYAVSEAEAVCLARDLVNTPANLLPPLAMADKARALCEGLPLSCTVLDRELLADEGLNALLAVGRGSANEPVLVCLEYAPAGHEEDNPLVLIGKGLAFDSGGISLKPSLGMHEMKSDMAGAAAVLAVMHLIARLGGPRRVIGLLPCAENMPDGLAMRPGDVIRTMKGTTVEVLNTDAEGRLVLCDALTYAQKHWTPTRIVDIATLTGACVVALGPDVAGLFATDDDLAAELAALGRDRGERFWRLPLWDEVYAENLKSSTADLANVGPREGGAISAAMFLKHFVDVPWAHLDIAGPSYIGKKKGSAGGATGFGVRTLAALTLR